MELSKLIRTYSKFDLYKDRIPEKIADRTLEFLIWSKDAFHDAKISEIDDIVAYTPSKWAWRINSLQIIVFGEFESRIELIDQLSELLAPIYESTLLLPIVVPVKISTWPMHIEYESNLFRHISTKSIYSYSHEVDQ